MKIEEILITTYDNPFDPFTESDDWQRFDCDEKGYCTASYIDRVVTSRNPKAKASEISDDEYDEAMKEIVAYNPEVYRIVRCTRDIDPVDLIN